jgi:hypothetical protein
VTPPVAKTTAINTARSISVASNLRLNTISFTNVEMVTPPANGTLSAFTGTSATYTPNPGFTGVDSFTYRGARTSPVNVFGDPRTVTISVVASAFTLQVNTAGNGFGSVAGGTINCGAECSDILAAGTVVVLTATPAFGHTFAGWTGCDSVLGSQCTVTMTGAKTVIASFNPPLGDIALPDFNADGKPDLLWRNALGNTYVWYMNGVTLISDAFVAGIDPAWSVEGVADFNGDGHPDIVWRNNATGNAYIWYMNGATFVSDAFLFALPPEWVIQGVADFNADGRPDFLMRNTITGNAFAWFFNDNVTLGSQFLFNIDPSWKVEGVADFNNDGRPDLLFRNSVSGLSFEWDTAYDGDVLSLGASSPPIYSIDPVWEVVQVADWSNDGKPDLVFRNAATGVVFVWYLDGITLAGSDFIIQIDPSWEIVPRR